MFPRKFKIFSNRFKRKQKTHLYYLAIAEQSKKSAHCTATKQPFGRYWSVGKKPLISRNSIGKSKVKTHLNNVTILEAICDQLALAHVVQPVQLSAGM
jgi:hypothetical protein